MPTPDECQHPADKSTAVLLLVCPDCGAKCSRSHHPNLANLCYDDECPLHTVAAGARTSRPVPPGDLVIVRAVPRG